MPWASIHCYHTLFQKTDFSFHLLHLSMLDLQQAVQLHLQSQKLHGRCCRICKQLSGIGGPTRLTKPWMIFSSLQCCSRPSHQLVGIFPNPNFLCCCPLQSKSTRSQPNGTSPIACHAKPFESLGLLLQYFPVERPCWTDLWLLEAETRDLRADHSTYA